MGALEEIEAAIEKLTDLRDAATPAPWVSEHREYSVGYAALVGLNDHTITAGIAPDEEPDLEVPDADLIVTLHRTIDAQLAILEEARAFVQNSEWIGMADDEIEEYYGNARDLARAILGTS